MRFLSLLFNPLGNLIWWIAKTLGGGIDRRLSPQVGWLLGWALVLLSAVSLVGAVYGTRDNALKLSGMRERDLVTITEAHVISAETVRRKTLTVEQTIVAEFAGDDGPRRHDGRVSKPVSEEYEPGDAIRVYVSQDGAPSFRNPEDPFFDAVLALIGIGIPLIALVFSLRYLRHRNRMWPPMEPMQAPLAHPDAGAKGLTRKNDVVVRGRQRVKSYEERRSEEIEMIRRMHEKAAQLKK